MIGELLEGALRLSVTWWLTFTALVVLTGALILWWLARAGEVFDRERGR